VLLGCYLCCSMVICVVRLLFVLFDCYFVARLLFVLFSCYLCFSIVICVARLLFVLFYVLFVCKCVLPPGDNSIAVNKYIILSQRYKCIVPKFTECKIIIGKKYKIIMLIQQHCFESIVSYFQASCAINARRRIYNISGKDKVWVCARCAPSTYYEDCHFPYLWPLLLH